MPARIRYPLCIVQRSPALGDNRRKLLRTNELVADLLRGICGKPQQIGLLRRIIEVPVGELHDGGLGYAAVAKHLGEAEHCVHERLLPSHCKRLVQLGSRRELPCQHQLLESLCAKIVRITGEPPCCKDMHRSRDELILDGARKQDIRNPVDLPCGQLAIIICQRMLCREHLGPVYRRAHHLVALAGDKREHLRVMLDVRRAVHVNVVLRRVVGAMHILQGGEIVDKPESASKHCICYWCRHGSALLPFFTFFVRLVPFKRETLAKFEANPFYEDHQRINPNRKTVCGVYGLDAATIVGDHAPRLGVH